jgi:shikimate kinase
LLFLNRRTVLFHRFVGPDCSCSRRIGVLADENLENDGAVQHVVLVGLMGAGKSTIGRAVARRLHRPYVDNDDELRRRTGGTAHALADREGLDALHREERATLEDAIAHDEPSVIGAAAATITDGAIREQLRREFVVWIDPSIDSLVQRFQPHTHRPRVDGDVRAFLERQHDERGPLYREVARLVVHPEDADDVAPAVDEIVAAVQEADAEDGRR